MASERATRLVEAGPDEAIEQIRARFEGVPSEEIEREAVKAVREVRRERAARRAAG